MRGSVLAQVHWTHIGDAPVLAPGPPDSWDAGIAFLPTVIKDGDTLKMWYTGSRGNYLSPDPMEIGYAWSLDGVNWTKYSGNPVLSPRSGEFDAGGLAAPVVIKDGDTLRMWYAAIGEGEPAKIPPNKTGYAWSLDGIHWNRLSAPVLQAGPAGEWDDVICNPGGVIKENGIFKMWYSGATYYPGFPQQWPFVFWHTGLATSTDGIHWTKYDDPATTDSPYQFSDPVIKAEPWAGTPKPWGQARTFATTVLPTASGYEMWPTGLHPFTQVAGGFPHDIGYAISSDGINWQKYADNPVLEPTFTWNVDVEFGSVILDGDTYRMWFTGNIFPDAWIGYATAPVAKPAALITSVKDVPNDQGRQVRVTWNSSRFDGIDPEKTIVEYNLWRKAKGPMGKISPAAQPTPTDIQAAKHPGGQAYIAGTLWDFVATVPARQFARYAYIAPTLGDATATDTTLSTFMVSAHTDDPMVYFDSNPATGYSVDNLAPGVPSNFVANEIVQNEASAIELTWDESEDEDFAYFALYRDGSTEPILRTIKLSYVDTDVAVGESHDYALTAFDFAGNESQAAKVSVVVTSVAAKAHTAIPQAFALHQNYPNPFNPETVIRFDVPRESLVQVEVYNFLGQKVRTLVDRPYAPGTYQVRWDGLDSNGRPLPSGVYAYQLHAGQVTITRKMVLIR
jgi:hypothetical protein